MKLTAIKILCLTLVAITSQAVFSGERDDEAVTSIVCAVYYQALEGLVTTTLSGDVIKPADARKWNDRQVEMKRLAASLVGRQLTNKDYSRVSDAFSESNLDDYYELMEVKSADTGDGFAGFIQRKYKPTCSKLKYSH